MTNLPQDIKTQFFKMLEDKISILDFEQWVYDTKELESVLSFDDYLELVSLNYKKSGAKYEVLKVLKRNVDLAELETEKMLQRLKEAQLKNENLPYILMEFYDLYSKGYTFLDDLALGYGLEIDAPSIGNYTKGWDELTEDEKNETLKSLSPELNKSLQRVIDWIENRKIVLKGEKDEFNDYQFDDFRNEDEKKPLTFTYDIIKPVIKNDISKSATKKWWEFWK